MNTRTSLVAATVAGTLAASVVAQGTARLRSRSIATPAGSVRLTIPRRFEPLLPGSVYPNRRNPVEPRGCPVAIVERGLLSGETREFFLERGFVVAEARRETIANDAALFASLSLEGAADPTRAVVVCRGSVPETLARRLRAAAVLDPAPAAAGGTRSTIPLALFLLTPGHEPSEALTGELRRAYGEGAIEKWYRADGTFPREAFRDAAEWLAIETTPIR